VTDPDPITLEIIQESLRAIGDEMFAVLRKTAMSAIIYEVLDAGAAVCDRDGNLACAGAGIPTFIGVLEKAVKRIIELRGLENVGPGDCFVTNDPFYGGVTHLNDIVLCLPVFAGAGDGGRDPVLIAWTAVIAHFNDVGGMTPGSMSSSATEIFQEGLRLPAVKLIEAGRPIDSVIAIMRVNSRLPDFMHGDLWAEIATVRLGERRLREIAERYGVEVFLTAVYELLVHGERVMRRALGELPAGTYGLAEEQDSGVEYRVAVTINAEEFVVDLRDNPPEDPGSANVSRDGSIIGAQMGLIYASGIRGAASAGHFAPLRVLTTPGTVFDPTPEAACSVYSEVRIRLVDLILRCLAPHLGDRLLAGGFASICGTMLGGRHPDTGRHFTIVEPQVGGWGASPSRDGNHAMFSQIHGDTFNCPAEIAEARYGLFVDRLSLDPAAGGEGRFRGGRGILAEYRVRGDGCWLTCAFTRDRIPPWPREGGRPGSSNHVEVVRVDGAVERYAMQALIPLAAGDVVRVRTAHGAGYGDPRAREPEGVLADLRDGLVSPARAREVYGITDYPAARSRSAAALATCMSSNPPGSTR
jgi:N-methylhydantoinase B